MPTWLEDQIAMRGRVEESLTRIEAHLDVLESDEGNQAATVTAQQTFTVTYDQLVRLAVLSERARVAALELQDIDEEAMAIVYEITGPFAPGTDEEEKFFEPFMDQVFADLKPPRWAGGFPGGCVGSQAPDRGRGIGSRDIQQRRIL